MAKITWDTFIHMANFSLICPGKIYSISSMAKKILLFTWLVLV